VRPYYEQDGITIYHGDYRDVLPSVSAEVVLTDPPYSSGGFQESGKSSGSIGTRDSRTIQFDNLSTRGYRLLMREALRHVNQCDEILMFTDWRMWIESFDAVEGAGWRVRNMLVWDKVQMGMGMPFRNQHELVVYGKRSPSKITAGNIGNVIRAKRSGNEHHPTEKPVDLLVQLLRGCVNTGLVVDPFAGSGSSLLAARALGRPALGVEIDEQHCETAARRLEEARAQQTLPLEASA
jgi:DNA modification methylase